VVLPGALLLVLLDITLLVVLTAAGVGAHLVLHRPWEIEAVGPNERLTWHVSAGSAAVGPSEPSPNGSPEATSPDRFARFPTR